MEGMNEKERQENYLDLRKKNQMNKDCRSVPVETPLYTSGVWENASKLFEGVLEFKSNTQRALIPSISIRFVYM